jgi:hypothetical protein
MCALLIVVSGALYLFTNNPRYLNFAWRVARFLLIAAAVFVLLLLLERYALVGGGMLRY